MSILAPKSVDAKGLHFPLHFCPFLLGFHLFSIYGHFTLYYIHIMYIYFIFPVSKMTAQNPAAIHILK